MKEPAGRLGPLLQNFFVDYLRTQKQASSQTIASYRDTFRLLLEFVRDKHGIEPSAACVVDLDVPRILSFLDHLEQTRHNSIHSRNLRLTAIRSFFRVVTLHDPTSVNQAARVLAIPIERADRQIVEALSHAEMGAILAAPDLKQWSGRRDHSLLLTLYNSGARVSEITALEKSQFCFGADSSLHLHGKGRKERAVPLWTKTACALQLWFREPTPQRTDIAFPNARGGRLTRNGVNYILQQAVDRAAARRPSLREKNITPRSVRRTTATHLLQSGVDISVISLWLGCESIETAHIRLEADSATKERSLSKLAPARIEAPRLNIKDEVLAFLATL